MKVEAEVKMYERGGKEVGVGEDATVTVLNHWNRRDFVLLRVGDGPEITLVADDLRRALDAAQKAHR